MEPRTDVEKLHALTQDDIAAYLSSRVYSTAKWYQQEGHVANAIFYEATLEASVQDQDLVLYKVKITLHQGAFHAQCTCSRRQSGWCEHIGAVLLAWIDERDIFQIQTEEETALTGIDLSNLQPNYQTEYRSILPGETIKKLREIARQRGIAISGTRKADIIEQIIPVLADRQATRAEMRHLDKLGIDLLAYMHLTIFPGYGSTMENILSRFRLWKQEYSPQAIRKQLQKMHQRGLILSFKEQQSRYYIVPSAIRHNIPPQTALIQPYPTEKIDPESISEHPFAVFNQKLYMVWEYLHTQHPSLSPPMHRESVEDEWPYLQKWPHFAAEIREIGRHGYFFRNGTESLGVPPPDFHLCSADRKQLREKLGCTNEEIEFYYMLLTTIQAVTETPGQALQTHPEVMQRILSFSPAHQAHLFTLAWQLTDTWSEMDMVLRSTDTIRVRRSLLYVTFEPENLYKEWAEGRLTVFRLLSLLEENHWVSLRDLLQKLHFAFPDLLHMLSNPAVWWLESTKKKRQFGTTFDDWQQSVGQFIFAMLKGPLSWLGIVHLGYQESALKAVRLTPLGAFVTGKRDTPAFQAAQAAPQDAIQFTDDLQIIITPGQVPIQLYDLLQTMGTLQTSTPRQFVYQITAASIQNAFDKGETPQTLLHSLGQICPKEIPEAWEQKLTLWHQNYGQLHLYRDITLLELADEYILQELLLNTSLRENLVYQFSPRLVAISTQAVDELVEEMEKRGYTPRVE